MAAPKIMQQGRVIPWLYILPALIVIMVFIVYPTVNTVALSFRDRRGELPASVDCAEGQPCWGIFENYRYALTHPDANGDILHRCGRHLALYVSHSNRRR
jgi:ABC-type sugar transport system permease subunit